MTELARPRRLPRFVPRRRLALLAGVVAPLWLLSGSATGLTVAWIAVVALALTLVIDAALTPPAPRLHVERIAPQTIGVGDRGEIDYRVASTWPGRLAIRIFHRLPPGVSDLDPGAAPRLVLHPRGSVTDRRPIAGSARGRHPLGAVVLRIEGPLGLVERSVPLAPADNILVTPSLAGVRRYRLLALQRRLRDAGIRTVRLRGEGTSFSNLRAYSLGDDPRHIDWKATAKRRTLITREFAVEQGQTVMIIIDAGRMMTQLAGELPRFEHVLASALTLADVAASGDDRVGLMIFDDEVRAFVPPIRGRAALPPIRDALVPAMARLVEPDYAAAFRTLAARHRKRSLLVIFSDVIDRRASAALIAHTGRSAARHLPLVVALRNDQLVGAAVPRADASAAALYETAAAEELVMAREEALHGMRQIGIDVIDTSPSVMTASVINRYLEIKARASL